MKFYLIKSKINNLYWSEDLGKWTATPVIDRCLYTKKELNQIQKKYKFLKVDVSENEIIEEVII